MLQPLRLLAALSKPSSSFSVKVPPKLLTQVSSSLQSPSWERTNRAAPGWLAVLVVMLVVVLVGPYGW